MLREIGRALAPSCLFKIETYMFMFARVCCLQEEWGLRLPSTTLDPRHRNHSKMSMIDSMAQVISPDGLATSRKAPDR
jgi:hypothetical protein